MALSMDEQRILDEIEKRLAADDPGLASCLTAFRRPGPGTVLRSPRARIIGSLFTVLLVALVSLMIYAMIPFRAHTARNTITPTAPGNFTISSAATSLAGTQETTLSASNSGTPSTAASAPSSSASRSSGTAAAQTQDRTTGATRTSAEPGAKP
jgi:DUF3040 family protein